MEDMPASGNSVHLYTIYIFIHANNALLDVFEFFSGVLIAMDLL